ncbi:MAG: hypothetical protein JHC95_17685 [Solirubrobacteraceae bacterium]|nr:hypothetical protein [Solirubrobacteraceae bacterium]
MASSVLVLLGVLFFVIDQMYAASGEARAAIDDGSASSVVSGAASTPEAAEEPGTIERYVEKANDVLRKPFAGIVPPDADPWSRQLIPAVLALLVYGVGLGSLANAISPKRRR